MRSHLKSGSGAVLVILGVFGLVTVCGWWLLAAAINKRLLGDVGWNYTFHTIFLLIPLLCLVFDRSRATLYGCRSPEWRRELVVGATIFLLGFAGPLLADLAFGELRLTPRAARVGIANSVLFLSVFVGFAEEFLYRGFFQGELNRLFGKPYVLRGTRVGAGLLVASLLFGVAHLLNPFNPLQGRFSIDLLAFAGTTILALMLGLVRERFGGLIVVSFIHLTLVLFVSLFTVGRYSGSALLLTWAIGLGILVREMRRRPARGASAAL